MKRRTFEYDGEVLEIVETENHECFASAQQNGLSFLKGHTESGFGVVTAVTDYPDCYLMFYYKKAQLKALASELLELAESLPED